MAKAARFLRPNIDGLTTVQKVIFQRKFPESISDYQACLMLHALGADGKQYRLRKGDRSYHAYRNYYDAGGVDIDAWEDLTAKGYAKKHKFYHVTVRGIRALEYLTQCRIWDACDCVADCRDNVLAELMKDAVSCGYGCWLPTSSGELSLRLAIPKSLILETLRALAQEGLVMRDHYGEMDEDGCVYCKHGWSLTKYAKEKYAEKYEELKQAEYKRIDDSLRECHD